MNIGMNIKRLSISMLVILCMSLGISMELSAHDTDIYINNKAGIASEPIVMFTLDYRSNLKATVCNTIDPDTGNNVCKSLVDEGYLAAYPTDFFSLIRAVLKKVLNPLGGFKVGFMMNHDNGACAGPQPVGVKCSNGAYIFHGPQSVVVGTDPNKTKMFDKLDRIPTPQGAVAHSYQGKELYFELFRYLTGQGIYNGHNGYTDYGTTNANNIDNIVDAMADGTEADGDPFFPWLSYDTAIQSGPKTYDSPIEKDCSRIYMINLMFAVSNQDSDSDTAIKAAKGSQGMDPIDLSGLNNDFSTVIRWMHDVDLSDGTYKAAGNLNGKQNVTSYFLVDPTKVNQTTNGYAEAGGTTRALELSTNPQDLIDELSSILTQILSVSTTFVAPSVAVNVYNRSQVENDIFIAMFQAQKDGKARWDGNIKKFQLGKLNGVMGILDVKNADAVNPTDGRIKAEALSFWTNPSELIYPDPKNPDDKFLVGTDGRFVDRGGCGSRIPGYKRICTAPTGKQTPLDACTDQGSPGMANTTSNTIDTGPRKIFTEPALGKGALRNLNADGTTAAQTDILAAFTGATAAGICSPPLANGTLTEDKYTACNLIRYVRGVKDNGDNYEWMMGDPLHSRPLPLNYGGGTPDPLDPTKKINPDIRIFVGSNDGMMHMIRNTTRANPGVEDGVEGWSFMPLESMKNVKTLKEGVLNRPHRYGVDGSSVAFVYDANGNGDIEVGDKAYLYFGMRRGGRDYYALDVTDPDNPSQLWTISNKTTGFSELGQTWSTPRIGYMLFGGSNNSRPVLIFAGGYDQNKDTHGTSVNPDHAPGAGGDDTMGRGIFVVNAETGALIWKTTYGATTGSQSQTSYTHAEMLDSIPSNVTAVDSDGNGLLDRIYVGDTGGKVWRVDMLSNDQTNWEASVLFSGGRHYDATATEDRRFFYEPDYVQSRDGTGSYDAIVIGTGGRADPLNIDINNWFYVIRDRDTSTGFFAGTSVTDHSKLDDITCTLVNTIACSSTPTFTNGWKLQLKCDWQTGGDCGEKALATALTLAGKIYFTTYQPANSLGTACDPNEGSGFLYIVDLADGAAVEDFDLSKAGFESYTRMGSAGIPSGSTSIGTKIITSDLKIRDTDMQGGYRTFWFEHVFDY